MFRVHIEGIFKEVIIERCSHELPWGGGCQKGSIARSVSVLFNCTTYYSFVDFFRVLGEDILLLYERICILRVMTLEENHK